VNVIITGVTGMVGEGVCHECLLDSNVEKVISISRKKSNIVHEKFSEIILDDITDILKYEDVLKEFDTCFFCAGVTSLGKTEDDFYNLTYDLTIRFANNLLRINPNFSFCYISGMGTDSTEKGKVMWARVKGKTENKLMSMPFKQVNVFRPGYLHPTKGLKNTLKSYSYIAWAFPLMKVIFSNSVSTLAELGKSMIKSVLHNNDNKIYEVKDIKLLANQ